MLCWLCLHSGKRHLPHRPPVAAAAGRRLPSRMALSLSEVEAAAFGALEKEAHLDEKLGAGVGAKKERAVIQAAVEAYEGALAANDAAALAEAVGEDVSPSERTLYHVATDHIAVFGGDPARRKDKASKRDASYTMAKLTILGLLLTAQVSKLMQPYASLALYGTPRDVGTGDQQRLVSQIRNGKLDVVYCWTRLPPPPTPHTRPRCPYAEPLTRILTLSLARFSNHGSRHAIRQACAAMPTVEFVEVGSLSVMSNCWSGARVVGATESGRRPTDEG
jgi:hypothetical protein